MLIYNIYPRQFGKSEYLLLTLIMEPNTYLITRNENMASILRKRCRDTYDAKRIITVGNINNLKGVLPSKILIDEYAFYDEKSKKALNKMIPDAVPEYTDIIICTTLNKNYSKVALNMVRDNLEPSTEFFKNYPTIVKDEYYELKNDLLGKANVINVMTNKLNPNHRQIEVLQRLNKNLINSVELGTAFYDIGPMNSQN